MSLNNCLPSFPVFAYGATGAGKTYTMLGSEKEPGIMYLTMKELYKKIEVKKKEKLCEVFMSYQEVLFISRNFFQRNVIPFCYIFCLSKMAVFMPSIKWYSSLASLDMLQWHICAHNY